MTNSQPEMSAQFAPAHDVPPARYSTPWSARITAAVVASAVTVALAHVINLLAFFIGNQLRLEVFNQANGYFLPTSLICFVLLGVLFLVGCAAQWYLALIAALASSILGALIGAVINVALSGSPLDAKVFEYLLGSIAGLNLIFVLATVILAMTVGRRSYAALISGMRSSVMNAVSHTMFVRPPSSLLPEGLVSFRERVPVDYDLAAAQWDNFVAVVAGHGWATEEIESAPDHADSAFVEDTAVLFEDLAVIAQPGVSERRGEIVGVETALRGRGFAIERIMQPGTLDGGDVLTVGSTVYVGQSRRTNGHGINQLRAILRPRGYSVVAVPIKKALHLKTVASALPDGTILGYRPLLDSACLFERFLSVPEQAGANVVALNDDTILVSAAAPETATLLSNLGYAVVTIDISEFEKVEGSLSCLTLRNP